MARHPLLQLLDNSIQLTETTRKQAEEAVRSLVNAGEVRRSETETTVQALLERGRKVTSQIAEAVQSEVANQLGWLANRVDDMEDQLESFVSRMTPRQGGGRERSAATAPAAGADGATAKKSTGKRSTAKRSTTRSTKKSTGKKAAS